MRSIQNVNRLVILALALLLVWAGVASAGSPAPPPEATGPHNPHQIANLGHFQFENGEVVKDFKVCYVTHGKLSPEKDNVILVLPQFCMDHHTQDFRIGPGKALDTDKYYIVAVDMLGCTVGRQDTTTGPTNSGLKMDFPRYTVRDAVNAEYKLLKEYLGFDHILAAIGGSYGADRAFQLAVSYPTFVRGIIPMSGAPWTHPETRLVQRNMMDIIALDSGWYGGRYETNPPTAVTTALLNLATRWHAHGFYATYSTPEKLRQKEKWARELYTLFYPQDARDVFYQLQALEASNVGDTPGFKGDVRAALQSIKARVLFITAKEDLIYYGTGVSLVKEAIPAQVTHLDIDSLLGHSICCSAYDREAAKIMDQEITKFLAKLR